MSLSDLSIKKKLILSFGVIIGLAAVIWAVAAASMVAILNTANTFDTLLTDRYNEVKAITNEVAKVRGYIFNFQGDPTTYTKERAEQCEREIAELVKEVSEITTTTARRQPFIQAAKKALPIGVDYYHNNLKPALDRGDIEAARNSYTKEVFPVLGEVSAQIEGLLNTYM